jgi:hypothetical protein
MEKTCGAEKPEDVEPNIGACDAFTHVDPTDPEGKRVLQGCPHRYYCPLSTTQVGATLLGNHKESAMSLFDAYENPSSSTVVVPATSSVPVPVDPAAYAAQVEAEKLKLLGLTVPSPPPPAPAIAPSAPAPIGVVSYGFCAACGTPLDGFNASKLPNDKIKHMGCSATVVPPPPPAPSSPIAVNPPDQPHAASMMEAAAPVPAEALAEIQNPQLKAEAEAHARAHAEKARLEAEVAAQQKASLSVWCNTSASKILITAEIAIAGKWTCGCGKSYTMKVLKPVKNSDGNLETVVPRHKPPKKDGEEVATAAPPPEKHITIIDATGEDEEEVGDDATVVVPPPPPPAPVVAAPVIAPPPPPAPPAPIAADVVAAVDSVVGMANGNGKHHVEADAYLAGILREQDFAIYTVEVHEVRQIDDKVTGQDVVMYQIIAESMQGALARAQKLPNIVEVLSVEKLPGTVLR